MADLPPPGGDQDIGWQLLVVHCTFAAIVVILLFARLYTRIFVVRAVGLDDYCIIVGVVSTLVSMILDVYQVRWGWGRHTYYLLQTPQSRANLIEASKLSSMNEINTILGLLFIKFSISLLMLRIFGTKKSWRWAIYSIMAFVFVTTVISAVMVLVQCRPLDKLWNPSQPGSCWSPETVINIGYYNGAVAVVSDWALSTIPIAVMWNLQISTKKKAGIATLMGIGYFTGVTAIVRTVLLKNLAAADITWDIIPTDNWAGVEFHVGIIAACVPAIKPLFSSSRPLPFKGWSRIFAGSSAPTYTSEDKRPLRKTPVRHVNSISDALSSAKRGPHHTGPTYGNDWTIPSGRTGQSTEIGSEPEAEFVMDDLEGGRAERAEEREFPYQV
ncbi:hypothetical protein MMC27_003130 [Xylographa pallens]|nr:hypothetical protein [Xylographa pallens]